MQNRLYKPSCTGASLMQVISQYLLVTSKDGSTLCGDLQRSNPWSAASVLYVCIGLRHHIIILLFFSISFPIFCGILVAFHQSIEVFVAYSTNAQNIRFPISLRKLLYTKLNFLTVTDYKHWRNIFCS